MCFSRELFRDICVERTPNSAPFRVAFSNKQDLLKEGIQEGVDVYVGLRLGSGWYLGDGMLCHRMLGVRWCSVVWISWYYWLEMR